MGFKILLEILAKGQCETVREVPITFEERLYGTSKLTSGVILEYLLQVIRLYAEKAKSLFKSEEPASRVGRVGSGPDP